MAGVRGLEIEGKFITFTANGVYLEESAIPWLAAKWKAKTAGELMDSVEFFRDIVTGMVLRTLVLYFVFFPVPMVSELNYVPGFEGGRLRAGESVML